jgi:L-malate glycosyltransferase
MKILFFTPTGARTGSEMVLWYLVKHLANSNIETAVYACQAGELFAKNSPAHHTYIHRFRRGMPYYIFEAIYHRILGVTPEESYIKYIHRRFKPDFWYINTITMPHLAALARKMGVPYIVHVHELLDMFDDIRNEAFSGMLNGATASIGCSSVVAETLQKMGIPNVRLLHSFIDTQKIKLQQDVLAIKRNLHIPETAYVWLMSGTMCMRKGYDMIPDLLQNLPKNAYIVWLGSGSPYGVMGYLEERVRRENLNFIALGAKGEADYYDYLNMCDGFVLTSREDPFPLVMIESAYLQKPIVGFNSGGISEFVQPGMGQVVPAFDIPLLAKTMQQVMSGEITIDKQKLRARALEFDVNQQLAHWQKLLQTLEK